MVEEFFSLFGYPFATEKRQLPSISGDFLGLVHDLGVVRSGGPIYLWIRERLLLKVTDIISTCRRSQSMRPGQASKLFGCVTFLDQGVFGRIARSGLNALKDRQYSVGAAHLTADLLQAFDTIECVLALKPCRAVLTLPHLQPRVLAASDAAQDDTSPS